MASKGRSPVGCIDSRNYHFNLCANFYQRGGETVICFDSRNNHINPPCKVPRRKGGCIMFSLNEVFCLHFDHFDQRCRKWMIVSSILFHNEDRDWYLCLPIALREVDECMFTPLDCDRTLRKRGRGNGPLRWDLSYLMVPKEELLCCDAVYTRGEYEVNSLDLALTFVLW